MRKSSGFTLIELLIAVSLASFVLVGVATIAARMARSQLEGVRSGTVTGCSLVSYLSMAKEIEDANVLAFPSPDLATSDTVIVCKNWSRMMGGALPGARLSTDATIANGDVVSVIQYCVDTSVPSNLVLRRFANVGTGVQCPCSNAPTSCSVPALVPTACVASPAGTWTETGVIGFKLERLTGLPVFMRDNSIGGVRVRYVIGAQTATANEPVAKFQEFNFGIAMQKQYNSALD